MTLLKIYMVIMLIIFLSVAVLGVIAVIVGLWEERKDYMKGRKKNE